MRSLLLFLSLLGVLTLTPAAIPPALPRAAPIVVIPDTLAIRYARVYHTSYAIAHVLIQKSNKYRIPHRIAFRLAWAESRFDTMAVSPTNAIGLTQVLLSTAMMMDSTTTRERLFEPAHNAEMGFRFLRQMRRRYHGDWWKALVAYNEGPAYMDTTTITTHPYADKVLYGR